MSEQTRGPDWPRCGEPHEQTHQPEAGDPERLAYIDQLKTKIRSGVYRPDVRDLARSLATMIVRDL